MYHNECPFANSAEPFGSAANQRLLVAYDSFTPETQTVVPQSSTSNSFHNFNEQSISYIQLKGAGWTAQTFHRFVSQQPDGVMPTLRDNVVICLGEFECRASDALIAFKGKEMLTYHHDSKQDVHYYDTWKKIIKQKSNPCKWRENGGQQGIKLVSYVVDIEGAAGRLHKGILTKLLLKQNTGVISEDIWGLPAVSAVIEVKWQHWARYYMIFEFGLFLCWLISYFIFVAAYVESDNLSGSFEHMDGKNKTLAVIAYICDLCASGFAIPFLIIELISIKHLGWQWFHLWNLVDVLSYINQFLITGRHLVCIQFCSVFNETLMAIQCALLFIRVQYFSRAMGIGASYLESLIRLVYHIRYLVIFIVASLVSTAFSFAVLYKEHKNTEITSIEDQEAENEEPSDFNSILRSLITCFAVALGSFETSYVFGTRNAIVKGLFFLYFQFYMSIIILNILIAVMTESYTNIMKAQKQLFNKSRAQLIEELEQTLPEFLLPNFKKYIHFIVIKKESQTDEQSSPFNNSRPTSSEVVRTVTDKLDRIENIIQELGQKVDTLCMNKTQH